VREEGPLN